MAVFVIDPDGSDFGLSELVSSSSLIRPDPRHIVLVSTLSGSLGDDDYPLRQGVVSNHISLDLA